MNTFTILKESDLRKEIKSAPAAGYLFFGDEDYLKRSALARLREAIVPDPSFAVFNDLRLDATDFTPDKLTDALMPLPMMSERKLVVLSGLNFNTMRSGELDALCEALSGVREYDYNTVVVVAAADCLDAGYLPKSPSATLKKLGEVLRPVQFERSTPAKLAVWVGQHFRHNGVEVSPEFCAELIRYCGSSMFMLATEIDKLSFYVLSHSKNAPTLEDLRFVCTPITEYDAFAFANALMDGKRDVALDILRDYKFRRVEPLVILGEVIRVFCDMTNVQAMLQSGATEQETAAALKLHAFRVGLYRKSLAHKRPGALKDALAACTAADRTLKLSPQGYAALERLICSV